MIDASSLLGEGDDSTTFMGAPPSTRVKSNGPLQSVNGYGACKYTMAGRPSTYKEHVAGSHKLIATSLSLSIDKS
jgi:hypothetical protein